MRDCHWRKQWMLYALRSFCQSVRFFIKIHAFTNLRIALTVKQYIIIRLNSYTGGNSYSGAFVGSFTSGHVRVRAWKLSDWPTPDFVSENVISISKGDTCCLIFHIRKIMQFCCFVTSALYKTCILSTIIH